jgi:hypothetical protein
VVRHIGIVEGIAKVPVCNLGHSSSHEVVKVERDGTIGYCFVSVGKEKSQMRIMVTNNDTNTWFSGRTTFKPEGVSAACTLLNI